MSILGVESVIYGVEDMALCTRFWEDFGLNPVSRSESEVIFDVATGSRVILRKIDDPTLPAAYFPGSGVRETVFGVDTPEALEKLVAGLATDRVVRRDPDGTAHFSADDGTTLALRVWHKKPVLSRPDPVNAPGQIVRLNLHRKWIVRTKPKTINHVVYFSDDYVSAFEFFRDRLGFRLTDHSKANGIFCRADGTYEHHTVFWVTTRHASLKGKKGYAHIAFGVDDIDEVMIAANYMQEHGWSEDRPYTPGLNRHRISSAIYYYFPCPAGGDAEIHCDTDYLDDNWIPRAWEIKFGALLWSSVAPGLHGPEGMTWDVKPDPYGASLEEYRLGRW